MASRHLDAKYRDLFRRMFDAWLAAPAPAPLQLRGINRAAAAEVDAIAVIHGWTARVLRTGHAALALHEKEYTAEAPPLIRSMIEHAIALAWIEDKRGDALQALVRKRSRFADRVQRSQEQGWTLSPEVQHFVAQAVEAETDEETRYLDELVHTSHQASTYGLGALFQAWLIESDHSHPSIGSSQVYVEPWSGSMEDSIELRHQPRDTGSELPASVALISYVSLQPYSRLLGNPELGDNLSEWHESLEALNRELHQEHQSDA